MTPDEFIRRWQDSGDARSTLADAPFRDAVYRFLHTSSVPPDPSLLRLMLEVEVRHYASGGADVDSDRLYWCAFLLSRLGRLEDVLPLWRAKQTDFDTAFGFDIQFVVGPGVGETIAFLHASADPAAVSALEHIRGCRSSGDFDEMDEWRSHRSRYFLGGG